MCRRRINRTRLWRTDAGFGASSRPTTPGRTAADRRRLVDDHCRATERRRRRLTSPEMPFWAGRRRARGVILARRYVRPTDVGHCTRTTQRAGYLPPNQGALARRRILSVDGRRERSAPPGRRRYGALGMGAEVEQPRGPKSRVVPRTFAVAGMRRVRQIVDAAITSTLNVFRTPRYRTNRPGSSPETGEDWAPLW
jgi:hypothetical protein